MPTGNRQRYRYGWTFACATLAGGYPDIYTLGTGLGVFVAVWSLIGGLAAAFVKPWGWGVLMLSYPLSLAWVPFYLLFLADPLGHRIVLMGVLLPFATISTAYFYKRRAMFGARWRWSMAERWCPQLVGPDTYIGTSAGFLGLSWSRRLLVVAVVLVFMLFTFMA